MVPVNFGIGAVIGSPVEALYIKYMQISVCVDEGIALVIRDVGIQVVLTTFQRVTVVLITQHAAVIGRRHGNSLILRRIHIRDIEYIQLIPYIVGGPTIERIQFFIGQTVIISDFRIRRNGAGNQRVTLVQNDHAALTVRIDVMICMTGFQRKATNIAIPGQGLHVKDSPVQRRFVAITIYGNRIDLVLRYIHNRYGITKAADRLLRKSCSIALYLIRCCIDAVRAYGIATGTSIELIL